MLFLEAPGLTYVGRQVNNVRRPVSRDPLVADYLATFDAEYEIANRGERANHNGVFKLQGAEARELAALLHRRSQMAPWVLALAKPIGPYSPCLCGSGKKQRWCHRGG